MDRRTHQSEQFTIETANGRLMGARAGGILSFKGIPYGKPPIGQLRWRLPEPAAPWAGVRDATAFGPACPQAPTQIEAIAGRSIGEQSEDCLYLNVWTPGCDAAKRAVMVWIHGGAFVFGAGSQSIYDGEKLAARDVVVVTINYRLGAFGFLDLSDATDGKLPGTGIEGLADQILALDWVKQNISEFGGDPDNVTVFGESAGGMSIGALLAAGPARGLFHKAIPQSGAAHIGNEREVASRAAAALLEAMGLSRADAAKALDVPQSAIVKSQIAVLAGAREGKNPHKLGRLPFQPTIDGALLRERPIDAVRAGAAAGVPILTGTTREEWRLFSSADPRLRFLSAKGFAERMARLAREHAPPILSAYTDGSPFARFNAVMTDKTFTIPATRLAEAQSSFAPAYLYRFDWSSPLFGGFMGSCHGLELGFVFGTYKDSIARVFFGTGPAADQLSQAMMESWTSFAKTGNPATTITGDWPAYDPSSRGAMIFGDGPAHPGQTIDNTRLKAWDDFPERKLGP